MDSLPNDYFQTEYKNDLRKLEDIDQLLAHVWRSLIDCEEDGKWPYTLVEGEKSDPKESVSTQSMVLFAICSQIGLVSFKTLGPVGAINLKQPDNNNKELQNLNTELTQVVNNCLKKLADNLDEELLDRSAFGKNNPFTLSWLLAVTGGIYRNSEHYLDLKNKLNSDNFIEELGNWIKHATNRIRLLSEIEPTLLEIPDKEGEASVHAFPALRAIHLFKMTQALCSEDNGVEEFKNLPSYKEIAELDPNIIRKAGIWFRSRMLDHLALASIKDAPFDAAELAFSLEGYLLCESEGYNGRNHDPDLVGKVFEVLHSRQEINPYWRPLKPVLTNERGFALLPLSVEIVNSLFRTCWLLEGSDEAYFTDNISVFNRYYEWIVSRSTHGSFKSTTGADYEFTGWHSEHVQQPGSIHVWETSQVAVYLMHYKNLLHSHLSKRALQAARLSSYRKKRKKKEDENLTISEYWDHISKKDPQPPESILYNELKENFIECRSPEAKGRQGFSLVLYGPPGTGKTSIAEDLAATLGWKFCEITPSDFVASGESEVELRAREIFSALSEQDDTVILFDEIDRLILDRDSPIYQQQGDMFQVMTPGMLPKLKMLRSRNKSIFILATNYWERLDPAAIRIGRIDQQFLVSLPNAKARAEILVNELNDEIKKLGAEIHTDTPTTTSTETKFTPNDLQATANFCVLAAYGELCELIRNSITPTIVKRTEDTTYVLKTDVLSQIQEVQNEFSAAVTLGSYRSRFSVFTKEVSKDKEHPTIKEPFLEFIDLAGLICENDGTLHNLTKSNCTLIFKILQDACIQNDISNNTTNTETPAGLATLLDNLADHPKFRKAKNSLSSIKVAMEDDQKWKT